MIGFITSFLSGLFTDIFYAKYIQAVGNKQRYQSANWSLLIGLCSIVFVENITASIWNCLFWLIGLYIGTLIVVKK